MKSHGVRLEIVLVLVYDKFAIRNASVKRYCHFYRQATLFAIVVPHS